MPFDNAPRQPKYDFKNPLNRHEDEAIQPIISAAVDLCVRKWADTTKARNLNLDAGQIAQFSKCALTSIVQGFYRRQAAQTLWANGEIVTVTDGGINPAVDRIEWNETAVRNPSQNYGLTARDQSPERAIELAHKTHEAKSSRIAHKIRLGFNEMARGALAGFDTMSEKGDALREQHMLDFNEAILRGIPAALKRGITDYPGIKRVVSTIDWATADPDLIYDEWLTARRRMYTDAGLREQPLYPDMTLLPLSVSEHFSGQILNPDGGYTTLRKFIEDNNSGHRFMMDPALRNADTFGHPGAILLATEGEFIKVLAPTFAQMQQPAEVAGNRWEIEIEIETIFFGVTMTDPRAVCFIDGGAAGWTV